MRVLHVTCSPRGRASESQRLSQTLINELIEHHRGHDVVITERGVGALAHIDGAHAQASSKRREPADTLGASGTLLQSEQLIRELESADYVVIATPMHNLTVPSTLKAWLDHVVQVDRTFRITPAGKVGTLHDRPVLVAIASGGLFSSENAQQPDFLRPYLKAVLATIGLLDVTFFSVEGTAQHPDALDLRREKAQQAVVHHVLNHLTKPPAPAPLAQKHATSHPET
ncbi:FMN-dependent NADH-azoreductase [Pseudomonas gingeri]